MEEKIQTNETNIGKQAFWSYDNFPYVISGVVSNEDQFTFNTHEFVGMRFKKLSSFYPNGLHDKEHVVFVDKSDGELIYIELKKLEQEYRDAQKQLLQTFKKKAIKIAPFLRTVSRAYREPNMTVETTI